jgi:hypothetical protein
VSDVHTPALAAAQGLAEYPGFDLLSRWADGERDIEVKGRARVGEVELSENEWARAATLREKYWLYVVFDCATERPRLITVRDPFKALIANAKGGVRIDASTILEQRDRSSTMNEADRPRLIEVAFPLKETSLDSVHEKNVRHGHISTLLMSGHKVACW